MEKHICLLLFYFYILHIIKNTIPINKTSILFCILNKKSYYELTLIHS